MTVPIYEQDTLCIRADITRENLSIDAWPSLNAKVKQEVITQKQVTVNLTDVGKVDSAGLAWLVNLKRDAGLAQVIVTFTHVPDRLMQLATLSGVNSLLVPES